MGKHGPCYHCGVTSTPLWRNGPPDKPVLCNACGSRWRTKGTLTNYTPLHSRAPFELEESKTPKLKIIYKRPKERKLQKIKQSSHSVGSEYEMIECVGNSGRDLDEDTSNRSSSGSAVSYSESCAHFGGMDMSDITGSAQSNVRDSDLPSHKRMFTHPKPSHVEKLTKDLHYILHQQSSYFSRLSEDDLLYDKGTPTGFVEIGHGGVLIRNSDSVLAEEESEASSLLTENKSAHSGLSLPVNIQCKGRSVSNMGSDNFKSAQAVQENIRRDNSSRQKFHIQHRDSDLGIMDLKDAVNFEVFVKHLTPEEQQHLMRYLPSVDTDLPPKSLGSMFSSIQFEETFYYFQQLIQEGVFDLSFCANSDDCRTLKKLLLLNLKKINWIERYRMLKDANHNHKYGEKGLLRGNLFLLPSNSASLKRPRDIQHQDLSEPKVMKSPMTLSKAGMVNALPTKNCKIDTINMTNKSNSHVNDSNENDGSCFSRSNQFAFPSNISSILDPLHFNNGNTDQDLLLDVCSNFSFPQAELLSDFCSGTIPVSFSAESEISGKDGCLSSQMSSSVGNKHVEQW